MYLRGAPLTTPTPIPSPQGGGEEFAAPANRIFALGMTQKNL
jgi:hypothetical protein